MAVIHTPADWKTVSGDWQPGTEEEAMHACGELVHVVHELRIATLRVLRDMDSIRDLPVRDPEYLTTVLSPPLARRTSPTGWRVHLWTIGPRDLVRYECSLGSSEAEVWRRDVLAGYGTSPSLLQR